METKRLFNWEVEKKIKELEGSLQFKEVTMVDLQEFILQHNYYNGESDEVFVYLCNAYFDRYATYEKAELLGPFLEKLPYKGDNPQTLFNLINATVGIGSDRVNDYLKRALKAIKDSISFLNNIQLTSERFGVIHSDKLKEILDLPGINTKFHQLIKFESFMKSLDTPVFIKISNQLYEKNTTMAIQYGLRAIKKSDFQMSDHLKEIKCACENDPPDQFSIAEQIMLTALKEGNAKKSGWLLITAILLMPRASCSTMQH